ncbi:DUF1697 domain-containing protein [Sagittula stellata]|uniref:DUF1697 domain-containing protein n=1 Tax=Sagittula stellata (strain ATCC 700073 / DSM 11524 / E-37) TaxID=388399 RepID=A3JYQ7_SAGS3|nr:DUF1697 domain-containing protein [Sagittula stellata]EBA09610.1 hypothetical protein SSE37_07378 [Sagittula stellata E-37]
MPAYAAFLRAVNVGGTGKLAMADLRAMTEATGAGNVQTYIASGNVAFTHDAAPADVQAALEKALEDHVGAPVGLVLRSLPQLDALTGGNPFPDAPGNKVICLLTDAPIPAAPDDEATHKTSEDIRPGPGALYIHYPEGQGRSRLRLPAMANGTARNLNTIRKVRTLLAERS